MSEPVKGSITYQGKRLMISWMAKKKMAVPNALDKSVTCTTKVGSFSQSGSLDVLVELVGGRPFRVWCPDEKPPDIPVAAPAPVAEGAHGPAEARYHNPYNFIPATPRDTLSAESDLADHAPADHDALARDRWSGRLCVHMKTATPLLIPDVARDPAADHKVYPIREEDGMPLVAPTSVKGMLRSAYEAITNSRMGVFSGHDVPLGMRRDSHSGLDMVPARIVGGTGVQLQVELYLGTTEIDPHKHGSPLDPDRGKACATMYAAWLPSYHRDSDVENVSRWKHGKEVKSFRAVSRQHDRNVRFDYWQVVPDNYVEKDGEEVRQFEDGWACISGKNMPPGTRKHDERIFFNASRRAPLRLPVTAEMSERWKNLIEDYYHANENDILKGAPCPPALGKGCEYSRHIRHWREERTLKVGTLCYATVDWNGNTLRLKNLYPVMISRDLQDASPDELLDASLKPALNMDHLSPADRVFGWVKDGIAESKRSSAYRGNLRVGHVKCETQDATQAAIVRLSDQGLAGLPLAIMGQPNPEQARFYAAKDQQGAAQNNAIEKKSVIYAPGKGIRGRKVYPHQNVPDGYWEKPTEDRTQQLVAGWYQEYRRPRDADGREQLDSQNRTMEAWVRPGTLFSFDIDVTNLSGVEFGALLWMLSLGKDRYLKFGGGKPLGFGSVNLVIDWDKSQFGQGNDWANYYSSFTGTLPARGQQEASGLIKAYQSAVASSTGVLFEQTPFVKAFLKAAEGFNVSEPSHYPRSRKGTEPNTVPPRKAGEGFKWFVENERVTGGHKFNGLALSDLASDRGLTYLEEYERPPRNH